MRQFIIPLAIVMSLVAITINLIGGLVSKPTQAHPESKPVEVISHLAEAMNLYTLPNKDSEKVTVSTPDKTVPVMVGPDDVIIVERQQEGWSFVNFRRYLSTEIEAKGWVPSQMIITAKQYARNKLTDQSLMEFADDVGRLAGEAQACFHEGWVTDLSGKARQAFAIFGATQEEQAGAVRRYNMYVNLAQAMNSSGQKGSNCEEVRRKIEWRLDTLKEAGF